MDRRDFLKGFGLAPIALIPGAAKIEEPLAEYTITTVEAQGLVEQTNQNGLSTYVHRKTLEGWQHLTGMDVDVRNKRSGLHVVGITKYIHDTRYPETQFEVHEQSIVHTRRIKIKMKDFGLWWIEGKEWIA